MINGSNMSGDLVVRVRPDLMADRKKFRNYRCANSLNLAYCAPCLVWRSSCLIPRPPNPPQHRPAATCDIAMSSQMAQACKKNSDLEAEGVSNRTAGRPLAIQIRSSVVWPSTELFSHRSYLTLLLCVKRSWGFALPILLTGGWGSPSTQSLPS